MQKFVGVVILMLSEEHQKLSILIGDPERALLQSSWKPFDERIISYLSELSRRILTITDIREFPDLVSLAYWCRPSALYRLQQRHRTENHSIGRGMVFHIPPANVPLNFAYSLFCGLLSGNSNVVRLSSTDSVEVNRLVEIMVTLHKDVSAKEVSTRICLVRYEHDDAVTRTFSMHSAARLIWGGDETIRKIRRIETAVRSIDVPFADRVSVALLNSSHVETLSDSEIFQLVDNFIADSYTFDQNACSSPRLVIWHGNNETVANAASRFWKFLEHRLEVRRTVSPAHHMLRFVELCECLAQNTVNGYLQNIAGGATRIELSTEDDWRMFSKLRFGTFSEMSVSALAEIGSYMSREVQTLSYFGYSSDEMLAMIKGSGTDGIDRVVPIGQALNFDTFWDGYDLIRTLTRTVMVS
jgi:hypothetical protein